SSRGGLRSSVDGTVDKLKEKAKDAIDRRGSSESARRVSTVLGRVKSHRKKNRRDDDNDDGKNNRKTQASIIFLDDSIFSASRNSNKNESEDSLQLHGSVASSLLTEDSDIESPPNRPSLTPRHSHRGYLTLSSPLITTETFSTVSATHFEVRAPSEDNLAPRHAKTLDAPSRAHRSPSPAGKLRDAFVPTRKGTAQKPGSDTESVKSGTSGGGFGGIFGSKKGAGSRRGSKASEDLAAPSDPTEALPPVPPIPALHTKSKSLGTTGSSTSLSRTATNAPATPPKTIEIPPETLITPPTPTETRHILPELHTVSSAPNPDIVISPSGQMISHRRARSTTNPPSKLSQSIPLTPTIEETKTPGGTVSVSSQSGGFFSSVFSAAQNAANQLTTTIANTSIPTGKSNKSGSGPAAATIDTPGEAGGEEVIIGSSQRDGSSDSVTEKKELAVETLGSGNLSLSHLGIVDSPKPFTMPARKKGSNSDFSQTAAQEEHASAKAEGSAAAQAVSAAYASEKSPPPPSEPAERPRSIASLTGVNTPPRTQSVGPDLATLARSGSVRSRLSGGRRQRHRGSSATTQGNTIAAAIGASTATLANPNSTFGTQGKRYAVQNAKRNRDFHQLFRSVPEDEYLIEDYSAALQRDILLQGRLYISEGHVCFSSNILGWVTNLVISFDEVVSVEKKNTAIVFPNAIVIQTLHARNVFASFVTRDTTYDLIVDIWGISHPNLKSSANGTTLDGPGTGDRTERAESMVGSDEGSAEETDEEFYDEDAEDQDGLGSFTEAGEGSIADSDTGFEPTVSRKTSAAIPGTTIQNGTAKVTDTAESVVSGAVTANDFPGAATHSPTECGDQAAHYDTQLIDTTIPAPLGKVYSMMFGPASGVFMKKWLIEDQKSRDLQMDDDKKGLGEDRKTFGYSFIKPLGGSIGPKQTKCIINQTLEQYDLEKVVTVDCSTQNPDVPSGNSFLVKTRYCLMWGPANATRLIMTCTIEWSAKSWLKGPIEKGTNDGQTQYAKDLVAALRAAVTAKAPGRAGPRGKIKGRKRERNFDSTDNAGPGTNDNALDRLVQTRSSWGPFEPLHGILSPVLDIVGTLTNGPVLLMFITGLVLWMWFRQPSTGLGVRSVSHAHRIAAYEEMWQKEESELWTWLEERVAMDRAAAFVDGSTIRNKQRIFNVQTQLVDEHMSELQMNEAIKVTQERLDTLRLAVSEQKNQKK
ncbi:hypothetical protein EJ05DRAFT_418131, partial [Pseudovirgaria hyperparasitica]